MKQYDQQQLQAIAELLETTMTNAGIMDDYDEIISNFDADEADDAVKYHEQLMTGLEFINDVCRVTPNGPDKYDVTRDGTGIDTIYSFHMTFLRCHNK